MLLLGPIFLLCGAAASLLFDLFLVVLFFPIIFNNYEMYLFDSQNFDLSANFNQAYLDVTSHYGITNMLAHSAFFVFFLIVLLRKPSLQGLGLLVLFYTLTIGLKLFFFVSIFGSTAFYYLPTVTLLLSTIGFVVYFADLLLRRMKAPAPLLKRT